MYPFPDDPRPVFEDLNGVDTTTLYMPPYTGAFYFYVEPNTFAEFEFVAQSNTGTTSGSVFIEGSSGTKYFGFFAPSAGELQWITIKKR